MDAKFGMLPMRDWDSTSLSALVVLPPPSSLVGEKRELRPKESAMPPFPEEGGCCACF